MLVGSKLFVGRTERAKIIVCLARGEWKAGASDFRVGLAYFDLSLVGRIGTQVMRRITLTLIRPTGLLAGGQITLRKVDGWQSLHVPPIALDLAA
jgi:hypothetical protein